MSRIRLGGRAAQEQQGSANRIDIDTDVFELLAGGSESEGAGSDPTIQRWLDCWRNA